MFGDGCCMNLHNIKSGLLIRQRNFCKKYTQVANVRNFLLLLRVILWDIIKSKTINVDINAVEQMERIQPGLEPRHPDCEADALTT